MVALGVLSVSAFGYQPSCIEVVAMSASG